MGSRTARPNGCTRAVMATLAPFARRTTRASETHPAPAGQVGRTSNHCRISTGACSGTATEVFAGNTILT
jgi:hypothetical protein